MERDVARLHDITRKQGLWIFILGVIFSLLCVPLHEAQAEEKHAVLVLVPGLSMEDYFLLLEDKKLAEGAVVGALNRVTAGPDSPVDEMLTLSAGARAETSQVSLGDWMKGASEGEVFSYHLPGFAAIHAENEKSGYSTAPGTLSETLRAEGAVVRFAGHSDRGGQRQSYAPFLTTDFQGRAYGSRRAVVDKDSSAPGGWRMNPQKTQGWVDNIQRHVSSSLTVVEWGDISRFEKEGRSVFSSSPLPALARVLREMKQRKQPLFLMGADAPTDDMIPFAMWTEDYAAPANRLFSTSTGQPYLGSSVDAASALAAVFSEGADPPLTAGETADLQETREELRGMQTIHDTRAPVLSTYISILILLLAAAFLYEKKEKSVPPWWMHAAVSTGIASPIAFVVIPSLVGRPVDNAALYTGSVTAAALVIGAVVSILARQKAPLLLSILLTVLLSIDLLNGAYAIQRSYLGYDPLIGARYGGIGNELGGFFTAAAIVCLEPVLRHRKKAVLPLLLVFLIITGSSALGKNAGVTIASGLMFGTLWTKEFQHAGWKKVLAAVSGGMLFLGVLLWGLSFTGGPSHIGAAFQQLLQGEWEELRALFVRKVEMNIKIIFHSNWTKLLITSYAIAAFYLLIEKKTRMQPSQQMVIKAGAAGSIFLLLLNDSGAVAAATSMFYLLCVRYAWNMEHRFADKTRASASPRINRKKPL
ncbi:hypothetical protein [Salibacterium qingdaonense]|uniref:Uncharacterized protein n=1 Tax=Salibacterium qingdaonense TaxID=266892 RepID=A0A1I4PYV2_9BACI|nr:hypothetical protein [Salibacterium qingdaonense]SFM32969.1 hypothetical protein SAMN04488054_13413 [Salibacterium qingdaonense]